MLASKRGLSLRAAICLGLAACLSIGGCGDGGGGGGSAASGPPTITSAASVSVQEGSTASFYQATASDPAGKAITYSITGGADAGRFAITASGALSFVNPPGFLTADDSDNDNVYLVTISATNGGQSVSQPLQVTVTSKPRGLFLRRIATGFNAPVAISAIIGDSRILVAEQNGAIYFLDPLTGTRTPYVDVRTYESDATIIAMTPDDSFTTNKAVYLVLRHAGGVEVERYLANTSGTIVPDNFGAIYFTSAPQYAGGGWVGYGPNDIIHFALGDAGGTGDPTGSAQSADTRLGKLVRVDLNPDPYAGASPVFYKLTTVGSGLHNPNGGTNYNGDLLIADNGQSTREEIDLFQFGTGLTNFGWPYREGTQALTTTAPTGLVDPVLEYPHAGAAITGSGVIGGVIYNAGLFSQLQNQYIFADRGGAIFSVSDYLLRSGRTATQTVFVRRAITLQSGIGSINQPVGIAVQQTGYLYIVDGGGDVFTLLSAT